mmetsp:Transcript_2636/g.7733  ORF Transcript_2636/g.7733 Transcript_2636/m.7733 type:complete len:209 (-) Transcript_2636:487-1113(-)
MTKSAEMQSIVGFLSFSYCCVFVDCILLIRYRNFPDCLDDPGSRTLDLIVVSKPVPYESLHKQIMLVIFEENGGIPVTWTVIFICSWIPFRTHQTEMDHICLLHRFIVYAKQLSLPHDFSESFDRRSIDWCWFALKRLWIGLWSPIGPSHNTTHHLIEAHIDRFNVIFDTLRKGCNARVKVPCRCKRGRFKIPKELGHVSIAVPINLS